MLNQLSSFWFELTGSMMENHVVHTDVNQLGDLVTEPELLKTASWLHAKQSASISNVWCADISLAVAGDSTRQPEK